MVCAQGSELVGELPVFSQDEPATVPDWRSELSGLAATLRQDEVLLPRMCLRCPTACDLCVKRLYKDSCPPAGRRCRRATRGAGTGAGLPGAAQLLGLPLENPASWLA